ncbi:MAG: PH domain-containing protein [Phycisphaerales bacterium]|nr:PH domain-containing protein [Phycisphaerales bacterium]
MATPNPFDVDPPPIPSDDRPSADADRGDALSGGPVGESELWQGRTHWKHFIGWIAGYAVLSAVGLIALLAQTTQLGAIFRVVAIESALGLIVVGRIALVVYGTRYRLSTERLFLHRGILSETIDQIELIRVDDIRITKRFVDRLMGLGTIDVLSTDFTDHRVRIEGVADPDRVAEQIRSRMRTARKKSVFVENL